MLQALTKVFRHCILRRKILRRILTYLYSIKYNEINVCHLDVQNHISYKKWYKYFGYRLVQKSANILQSIGENF